jgi:hypothetical protein
MVHIRAVQLARQDDMLHNQSGHRHWGGRREEAKSEETGEEDDLVVVLGRRDELGLIGPGFDACEKDARGEREL